MIGVLGIGGLLSLVAAAPAFMGTIAALPFVAGVAAFFSTKFGRAVLLLAALGVAFLYVHHRGEVSARAECQADALRLQLEARQKDLLLATERAGRAERVLRELQSADEENRRKIAALADELQSRPLQSTKPGAKTDANALLDDQCRLTDAGARRLRSIRR